MITFAAVNTNRLLWQTGLKKIIIWKVSVSGMRYYNLQNN